MRDFKGAALMIDAFLEDTALLADRRCDADWCPHILAERVIAAYIPSKTNRKAPIPYGTALYHQSAKRLRPCSANSRTGVALRPVTTAACTCWLRRPFDHVRHLHRRNCHLLTTTMNPEPSYAGWMVSSPPKAPAGLYHVNILVMACVSALLGFRLRRSSRFV